MKNKSMIKGLLSGITMMGLLMVSTASFADDISTVTQKWINFGPNVAEVIIMVSYIMAIFCGIMFGWKIYQHGKDSREHKLATAFYFLLAGAALVSAGYLVSTGSNSIGASTKANISGNTYTSFGS